MASSPAEFSPNAGALAAVSAASLSSVVEIAVDRMSHSPDD
jgi:hypothetical protein